MEFESARKLLIACVTDAFSVVVRKSNRKYSITQTKKKRKSNRKYSITQTKGAYHLLGLTGPKEVVLIRTVLIGTLTFTTARCYYSDFDRVGLG